MDLTESIRIAKSACVTEAGKEKASSKAKASAKKLLSAIKAQIPKNAYVPYLKTKDFVVGKSKEVDTSAGFSGKDGADFEKLLKSQSSIAYVGTEEIGGAFISNDGSIYYVLADYGFPSCEKYKASELNKLAKQVSSEIA